jgi:hypothetical protein
VEWEHAGDGGVTARNTRAPDAPPPGPDEVFANSFSVRLYTFANPVYPLA